MLIETKKLTTKQLLELWLAVTNSTHAQAAEAFEWSIHFIRDRLRGIKTPHDSAFREMIEVDLMKYFETE